MFIWKYIDIPQPVIETIQQEFLSRLPNNELFFQYIKIDTNEILGLKLGPTVLIQMRPMGGMNDEYIHTDFIPPDKSPYALNIPLQNCDESITSFWKANKPAETRYTTEGTPYKYLNPEDCEKISELKFIKPFIFDTTIPHSVMNPQNVWRRGISLRFVDDPSHLTK
jgi:hypothetical protein